MIAPVFEQLAAEKGVRVAAGGRGAAFTKIDLRIGAGGTLATEWGVRATPTFMFFLDGTKVCRSFNHRVNATSHLAFGP
jgi:thiol-disulfide isomerase/thioredoxin